MQKILGYCEKDVKINCLNGDKNKTLANYIYQCFSYKHFV